MKTILFADDDPVIVQVYRGALQKGGYRVEVANDGLAAMKMMLPLLPDLVVLDLMMPKVDGEHVLKYIHSRPELNHTKVVVLSTATLADAAHPALAQKPDRVFYKGEATPNQLLKIVGEMLGEPGPA